MASAAAKRYARAVFELARDGGDVEAWRGRLASVSEVFAIPEMHALLANRALPAEQRARLLTEVAGDALDGEAQNLARLLLENGRVAEAAGVLEEFDRLADAAEGRVRATAVTAVELDEAERRRLERDLAERFAGKVRLETQVDPEILGGLVLRVGDHLVDASVRTRLQQLRRRLATSAT